MELTEFFWGGEPVEESTNGRRGVGVKVDVGEQNSSCLFRMTRLRIRLWSELSGHSCSWDSRSEVWNLIPFEGEGAAILRPALSWKWANCLNPLIRTSILLAGNLWVEASGKRKRAICPIPLSSGGGEVTHRLNLHHPGCVIFM